MAFLNTIFPTNINSTYCIFNSKINYFNSNNIIKYSKLCRLTHSLRSELFFVYNIFIIYIIEFKYNKPITMTNSSLTIQQIDRYPLAELFENIFYVPITWI